MKTENKISDSQFAQMQELEDDLPGIIRRLKDNEEYLDTVNRDLRNLGAEKAELEIEKEECQSEQKHLKSNCYITHSTVCCYNSFMCTYACAYGKRYITYNDGGFICNSIAWNICLSQIPEMPKRDRTLHVK